MVKKMILFGIIILVLIVIYNLINQIIRASKSEERLSSAAEVIYNLENKNKELKKKLSEIQTPEFIEQQARNKLGLGKKGETVVIIPDEKLKEVLGASESATEARLPNWLGWFRLFFK